MILLPHWLARSIEHAHAPVLNHRRRRPGATAGLEILEGRTLFAAATWDGGGLDANWATAANWALDVAPVAGDVLVFPAAAAQKTNTNNFLAGTAFASITLEDGGYNIGGNAVQLSGGVSTSNTTGSNTLALPLTFIAAQSITSANAGTTLTLSGAIDNGGFTPTLGGSGVITASGVISGAGGLAKADGADVTLTADNTYTGATGLSTGGALLANNTGLGSATGTGALTAGTGTTLRGSGTVSGAVTIDGGASLAPGAAAGGTAALNTGSLALASTATLALDLNGATAGTGHDQASVTGTVALGGATLSTSLGYIPVVGDQLTIVNNDGTDAVTGTFGGLAEGAVVDLGSGNRFRITYQGGTGNDVVMTRLAASSTAVSSATNPTVSGQSTTFTATVTGASGTPTGTVTFQNGTTTLGTGTLDAAGQATLATSGLGVGSHSITVLYDGSATYDTSTSAALTQTVNKAGSAAALSSSANPSVFGQSVTLTATLTAAAPGAGTPSGLVEFFNGTTSLGTATLNGSGVATLGTSALATGSHSLTVTYAGDTNFNGATSAALTQAVNQASTGTVVATSATPTVTGQSVTFTATVSAAAPGAGTPTGAVTFKDGTTTLGTGTLDASGQATYATSALTAGSHSITAVYGGDTDFVTSTSAATTQTVDQASTTTAVASSNAAAVVGESVTLTANVAAVAPGGGTPTGTVTFMDGATTLGTGTLNASGQATFATSALGMGTHSITAVYAGDTGYTGSTSPALTQSVAQAGTTTAVTSSNSNSVSGELVTFTATVAAAAPGSGTPTGTVTFKDGTTTLGTGTLNASGQATLATSSLAIGNHTITVEYAGDTNYTASTSATLTQSVGMASTAATLATSANPSAFGQGVTFTATVAAVAPGSGTPSGTVTFNDGTTLLGTGTLDAAGVATFATSALSTGSHSMTAVYGGDATFGTSTSAAVTQAVDQAATTASVSSSNGGASTYGESTTFTATVFVVAPGAGTPTGTVTFMDGATTLGTGTLDASGQTTFATSALKAGSHSITAVYGGDTNFQAATSPAVTQTVSQAGTATSVAADPTSVPYSQTTTLTASVAVVAPGAGTPTGLVEFFDGTTSLGTAILDGSGHASLGASTMAIGSHSITAVYGGDANFAGSTSGTPATVEVTNNVPTTAGIANVTVNEDAADTVIDLGPSFADVENTDAQLTYAVIWNSDPDLFASALVSGQTLTLDYATDAWGGGSITVRATDTHGASVATTFTVAVNSVQDPGTLQFASAASEAGENSGTFDLVVTRSNGVEGAVSADYAVTGGTASNADFVLAGGTLLFADGEASKTISVTLTDDALDEDAETLIVTLNNPVGGATLGVTASSELTIADDDAPPSVSIADVSVSEGDSGTGTVTFAVTLSGPSGKSVGVDWATGLGTAQPGSDYVATSGSLSFNPGETTKTASVTVYGDAQDEADESILLTLSNPSNASVARASAIGWIMDDDNTAPAALDHAATGLPGAAVTVSALAGATDVDGDVLTLSLVSQPPSGSAAVDDNGTPSDASDDVITYTPAAGAYGAESFTYRVSDGRGGSADATITVSTAGAALIASPNDASEQDLVVVGTPGDDNLRVYAGKKKGQVKVQLNGQYLGTFRPTGSVIAFGGDGNDKIQLKYLSNGAVFYGGAGNDRLDGSRGADVLIGGDGDDRLEGYEKRDLLIGGDGADRFNGRSRDDILIGGTTAYDGPTVSNRLALTDIVTRWNDRGSASVRKASIKTGVGSSGARLDPSTVFADDVPDRMGGRTGKNWIFGDRQGGVTADLLKGGRLNDAVDRG